MNEEYYTQSDKTSKTISLKISSPFEKKKKKQHAILAILNFQFTNREAAALFPFEINCRNEWENGLRLLTVSENGGTMSVHYYNHI